LASSHLLKYSHLTALSRRGESRTLMKAPYRGSRTRTTRVPGRRFEGGCDEQTTSTGCHPVDGVDGGVRFGCRSATERPARGETRRRGGPADERRFRVRVHAG